MAGNRTGQSGQRKIIFTPRTTSQTSSRIIIRSTPKQTPPSKPNTKGKAKETELAQEALTSSLYYEDLNNNF